MSSVQENLEQLSLKLSQVLDDIGISEELIQKRRQSALFKESIDKVHHLISSKKHTVHRFGSQSEGTTTLGIDSDEDILASILWVNVINDWCHWKHGKQSLLMLLRDNVPLAADYIPDDKFFVDNKGRVLLKNTAFHDRLHHNIVQHGPAMMISGTGCRETDMVPAFHCEQWPIEARQWLTRENVDGWPNVSLKSKSERSGCFLVPVDSKISGLVGVEWRISTNLAERHLMFSLKNIHMKCYVMMKVLLKSYDVFHGVVSSYMCKTAILHCVENTMSDFWQERNLITCLDKVLYVLYNFIVHVKCPHFIIPENNLMAGKISPLQQQRLLEVLEHIIRNKGRILQNIQIDNIGERLRQKFNRQPIHSPHIRSRLEIHQYVAGQLLHDAAAGIDVLYHYKDNTMKQIVCKYQNIYNLYPQLDDLQQKAACYTSSMMCTAIGSLMASYYISIHRQIPDIAIEWLKFGLNTDVSSSLLKLATVYYSIGNMNVTADILSRIDQRYDRNVVLPVCGCTHVGRHTVKEGFMVAANNGLVTDFRHIVSYCVTFMYNEINIVPLELRQEFFRSSQEEIQRRDKAFDEWMDSAVVDSLPYLYFLQYKVYRSLGKNEEKHRALNKLKYVMNEEPNLRHKETIYNLLGQCMEQENLPNDAFHYYERSLQERPEHNAANFYRSRLLSI
ncbi:hypothetical protein ACF0H5_018590 [Mactra antiquata]